MTRREIHVSVFLPLLRNFSPKIYMKKHRILPLIILSALFAHGALHGNPAFSGNWKIDRELSTAIDPWRRILLNINVEGDIVKMEKTVTTGRRNHTEEYKLNLMKTKSEVPIEWWTGNRHIGAYIGGDENMEIQAEWLDQGQTLRTESEFILQTSQGETPVREYSEYRLSRDGNRLTVMTLRSSRPRPIYHVFDQQ